MERLCNSHIKKFLEEAPLYVWHEYAKPRINRGSLWIREIDAYCESCEQVRPFQTLKARLKSLKAIKTGHDRFVFTCKE